MHILFVTIDYAEVVKSIYGSGAGAASATSYSELLERRNATLFARCDYLTEAIRKIGYHADAFYLNNLPLQIAWRREQGTPGLGSSSAEFARQAVFYLRRLGSHGRLAADRLFGGGELAPQSEPLFDSRNPLVRSIAAEQIGKLKPDIIYNYDPVLIDGHFLKSLSGFSGKLVAQIAAPYPTALDWSPYDLVVSSLPNLVERFTNQGVPSAYLPLYFAPDVLGQVTPRNRDLALTFVGSVSQVHAKRRKFLEHAAKQLSLDFYGSLQGERPGTALDRAYRGPAWGRDMYIALARSRLTLNMHIDIAEGFANNLRLYEATGMGACLVTEWGKNLADLFEPGREVVAYKSLEECVDLCRYYLDNPAEAEAIAIAGQRRCLAEHTTKRHAERLDDMLRHRL